MCRQGRAFGFERFDRVSTAQGRSIFSILGEAWAWRSIFRCWTKNARFLLFFSSHNTVTEIKRNALPLHGLRTVSVTSESSDSLNLDC